MTATLYLTTTEFGYQALLYTSTVSGTDLAGNAYSGTESITLTIDASSPTVTLTDTDSDNLVSVSEQVVTSPLVSLKP